MRGDFTRLTFRPPRHFSSVRLQQGRVQLDADWNEQIDIQAHLDQTTTQDVVGHCGAPLHEAGFAITLQDNNLQIGAGRCYVDGILCENEQALAFTAQPDLPDAALPTSAGTYLAYLDVWQRHLTALEEPGIREVALGGPDTASRTKTVGQVQLEDVSGAGSPVSCSAFGADWMPANTQSTGQLRAQAQPSALADNPCIIPPGAGFRRIENQLYRVEIHDGSERPDGATFKWSRDNGSIVTRLENITGNNLAVSDPGKDTTLGFTAGQWVELSDEERTLRGAPGVLVKLALVQGNTLTVSAWPDNNALTMANFGMRPTVRRWDSDGAMPVTAGTWLDLEDGVQVQFGSPTPDSAPLFRAGDYWLIPARTLTGNIEWPQSTPDAQGNTQPLFEPRHGIAHHYCPLALLQFDGTTWTLQSDCRKQFPPLTEISALYYVSGDGQEAMPDLTLPPSTLFPLPQPLQVGVANRVGALVRFRVTQGNGRLQGNLLSVDLPTGNDGIASCTWSLEATTQSQQVEAQLLDDVGNPLPLPVRFNANLSVASQVAYKPPDRCTSMQDPKTVQAAIDQLVQLPTLVYVGGDGQEAMPTDPLPQLLQVAVINRCGLIEGAIVRFVTTGNGRVAADQSGLATSTTNTIDIPSLANGIASCAWRLENNPTRPSQQLEATLLDRNGSPVPAPIRFTANLSLASQVSYDPRKCANLAAAGVKTVQEAIDQLCQATDREPGMKIVDVRLRNNVPLRNDTDVPAAAFSTGLEVLCDQNVSPEALRNKPVCFVTVELPFPSSIADRQVWGDQLIGFQPIILAARVESAARSIFWVPENRTQDWLQNRLFDAMGQFQLGNSVLARLTLKGNFIWSQENPAVYLDGEAFGMIQPGQGNTDIDLRNGSGDGRRGGDFEMWFRLVRG
jgi:hypothetical protein